MISYPCSITHKMIVTISFILDESPPRSEHVVEELFKDTSAAGQHGGMVVGVSSGTSSANLTADVPTALLEIESVVRNLEVHRRHNAGSL